MHEHATHCVHPALKFCERCDATYCNDCKSEWRKQWSLQDALRQQARFTMPFQNPTPLGGKIGAIQSLGMHSHS